MEVYGTEILGVRPLELERESSPGSLMKDTLLTSSRPILLFLIVSI